MNTEDYAVVSSIATERADIGIIASSTPTGHRGVFYNMCCDESWGYRHWHFASHRSPYYTEEMDIQEKATKTQTQYEHEILAEFGVEESGVFPKDKVDAARKQFFYTYAELNKYQLAELEGQAKPLNFVYKKGDHAPQNLIRTMGVDWDKYSAGSSIVVLDYDMKAKKFWVMNRVEVTRGEYSLTNAVNKVIEINEIYDPRWIFVDRGFGETNVEMLHLYGERHPNSGLKNKVEGYSFRNVIDVPDAVRKTITKQPMKQFMVNALVKCFEDERMILSPFDDILHKQLIDYCVDHITQSGQPVYTSENEHFVDALGLAYLAMVLKFPEITQFIKEISHTTHMESGLGFFQGQADRAIRSIESVKDPWNNVKNRPVQIGKGPGERAGEYQQWVRGKEKIIRNGYDLSIQRPKTSMNISSTFSRNIFNNNGGRTMW